MGELWGGLFVLGLIMPGIVLLVSSVVVLRFAVQRGRLDPKAWPPWQYLIIHIFLGVSTYFAPGSNFAGCI